VPYNKLNDLTFNQVIMEKANLAPFLSLYFLEKGIYLTDHTTYTSLPIFFNANFQAEKM
jgi:hypothetical protein